MKALDLAPDLKSIFELYHEEIRRQFDTVLAYTTKNLPFLVARFVAYGIERPAVLPHINRIGFGMNPSREACEKCFAEHSLEVMAIDTLAWGYLRPTEAYSYLGACRELTDRRQ